MVNHLRLEAFLGASNLIRNSSITFSVNDFPSLSRHSRIISSSYSYLFTFFFRGRVSSIFCSNFRLHSKPSKMHESWIFYMRSGKRFISLVRFPLLNLRRLTLGYLNHKDRKITPIYFDSPFFKMFEK